MKNFIVSLQSVVLIATFVLLFTDSSLFADDLQLTKFLPALEGVPDTFSGTSSGIAWKVTSGKFVITRDVSLGKNVLTAEPGSPLRIESKIFLPVNSAYKALVRLRADVQPNVYVKLNVAMKSQAEPGFSVDLNATKGSETVNCAAYEDNVPLKTSAGSEKKWAYYLNPADYFPYSFSYNLKSYTEIMPGWPEDFRVGIESDMSSIPDRDRKWLEVRVEHGREYVRVWLEDHLVAEKRGPGMDREGFARIEMSPGVELAEYTIEKMNDTKGFLPVRISGYANAKELIAKSSVDWDSSGIVLGSAVKIGNVPFVFSGMNNEGNDHIDVGRSYLREANSPGYHFANGYSFAGSMYRDPCRIQLRLPNGQYNAMYVIAGFDDESDNLPLVSAMFYQPHGGFPQTFEARIPSLEMQAQSVSAVRNETNMSNGDTKGNENPSVSRAYRSMRVVKGGFIGGVKAVPVTLSDGSRKNLWLVKIPLDPGRISSFADVNIIEVELTKKVHLYRTYPDPVVYAAHQGGLPSGVHIYAVTLGECPVGYEFYPDKFGHVWTEPEVPGYTVGLINNTDVDKQGRISVIARSYDGKDTVQEEMEVVVAKNASAKYHVSLAVKKYGYYDVSATLNIAGNTWTETRSLVRLAPDNRSTKWTEGRGSLFGYWAWHGTHYTPKAEDEVRLMVPAGARTSTGAYPGPLELVKKHGFRPSANAWSVGPQTWASEDPYDTKKYEEYKKAIIDGIVKSRESIPEELRPDHVYFYAEPTISLRLTHGNYPEYWGEKPYEYTEEEKSRIRMFYVTAKCAAEAYRKAAPDLKILIPWGDPVFAVPLLRNGFPKELIDGAGLDNPNFERLPEMQLHQVCVQRLYQAKKEYEKAGIPNPVFQYCEAIFVPTEPGACSWREQMDIYNRWYLISMSYGVRRFVSGTYPADCGGYWGSVHYGCAGMFRRFPYTDPKPSYAGYATMTDALNEAEFVKWINTGSLTTYCLQFKGPRGIVYTLWTIRGKRPVTLTFANNQTVKVSDAMNNSEIIKSNEKKITLTIDPSVIYVTLAGEVVSVSAGMPEHSDAMPKKDAKQDAVAVADLGDGSWKYTSKQDTLYENNTTFCISRYPGRFSETIGSDARFGNVLVSKLEKQDTVHELMPWYNVLTPAKSVVLPGAGSALGLWVKGASDWGRVVYCLIDAKGERWVSVGSKDDWNCDDIHSWSSFNFDGWRYLTFELPGHLGYDNYRRIGTTWWRNDNGARSAEGDGVVDLPLTLEKIIVEQRTHIIYVNDVQPVVSDTVCFGKLFVEYEGPEDSGSEAIRISRIRKPVPKGNFDLPNKIKKMETENSAEPTEITKIQPPEHEYDGTRCLVYFNEKEGAKNYFIWVGAYPDGRGAVNLTPSGIKNGGMVYGLRPGITFYFWIVYQDAADKMSKPSKAFPTILYDTFAEK